MGLYVLREMPSLQCAGQILPLPGYDGEDERKGRILSHSTVYLHMGGVMSEDILATTVGSRAPFPLPHHLGTYYR